MVKTTSSTIFTTSCRYHPHHMNLQYHNLHEGEITITYQTLVVNHYYSAFDHVNCVLEDS